MKPFEKAWNYAIRYDKRKLAGLTKVQCLAIGYEKGMESRSGFGPYVKKSTRPMKVFVKPKEQ